MFDVCGLVAFGASSCCWLSAFAFLSLVLAMAFRLSSADFPPLPSPSAAAGAPNARVRWLTPSSPAPPSAADLGPLPALAEAAPGLGAESEMIWAGLPAGQDIPPGALLEHMSLAPCRRSELRTVGPMTWAGPCLTVPPDGLCIVYCYLAAQAPDQWAAAPRSEVGFIQDRERERALCSQAKDIRQDVIGSMRAEGLAALADGLERGALPGDEEFRYYAERFGCAFLVVPEDADGLPTIYGRGPVGFEVKHTYGRGRRGEAVAAGHYVFARSWLPQSGDAEMASAKARASAARSEAARHPLPRALSTILRRLRGKQSAPEYGPPPHWVRVALQQLAAQPSPKHGLKSATRPKRKGRAPRALGSERPSNFCAGFGGAACVFSTRAPGGRTACRKGARRCALCSEDEFGKALSTPRGRGSLTRILKALALQGQESNPLQQALRRVGLWAPDCLAEFGAKASQPKRSKAPARVDKAAVTQERWASCKRRREANGGRPDAKRLKAYRASVLDDQRRAKKQFFPDAPRRARESGDALLALVPNDCDLPPASASFEGIGLQNWCEKGAWGMCPSCFELQPRRLLEKDLQGGAQPELPASACRRCRAQHPHYVPRKADVPEPLRDLPPEVVQALRPLEVDVGPEVRADNGGYRKKVRMISFSWCAKRVKDKVRALRPDAVRRQAKKALKYLLACSEDNEYADYYRRQEAFLVAYDPATGDPKKPRRPLHFIEEVGLETALWPHLYWKTSMCESFERLTDKRLAEARAKEPGGKAERAARKRRASSASSQASGCSSGSDGDAQERRHSIKKSFQAKLLSPLLGYGADFELLQYVFDLHLWTDLGSKKNQSETAGMRIMMSGHPMSPMYWADLKHGLFDLVRQLGFPDLYWTLAPWEQSYPYHDYLLDELQKLLRARTRVPALEAMHMAHTMFEICRGLVAGEGASKAPSAKGWKRHLLASKAAAGAGVNNCVHFFTRLEFQDGSKKQGTQRYHGSGRPHVHALFWVRDLAAARLEESIAATLELEGEGFENLVAFAGGSQRDQRGDSRWPQRAEASAWDAEAGRLRLRHSAEDHSEGVRGYILPVMDALRCHQDVQMAGGRGLLLAYVTKYVAKWSDSSYDEWMADSASATSLCRKVLFEYHPMEPEMVLQLCGAQFRQWDFGSAGGGRRSVRAPRPGNPEQPPIVDLYLRSSWRRDSMSLLEFLRKSDAAGKTGGVAAWLRRKWKAECRILPEDARPSLEEFANEYVVQGEQLVAVEYLWRLNDVFYGQWCMMNLPFRSLDVFDLPAVRERVPARYRWLATALVLSGDPAIAPPRLVGYWRDPARIAQDLQLEGSNDDFVRDIQAFVAGHALWTPPRKRRSKQMGVPWTAGRRWSWTPSRKFCMMPWPSGWCCPCAPSARKQRPRETSCGRRQGTGATGQSSARAGPARASRPCSARTSWMLSSRKRRS